MRSRLAISLILVTVVAILGVTVAALIGTQRGFTATESADRQRIAEQVAAAVSLAYVDAGGWDGADLGPATSLAESAGARLIVRPQAEGGGGHGGGSPTGSETAEVVVAGQQVGSVRLAFGQPPGTPGRSIAWAWIAAAAALAIVLAIGVAWWLSARLSAPLSGLAHAVRAFGAGNRETRAPDGGPGEIGDLSRAFDDMADRIQRGEDTRRALAHDVAHELRTPLAALQAGLEELRDGLVSPDPGRLAALHDQSLRMGRIVDDLGRLSEAEAPDVVVRLQPVDVESVTGSAIEEAQGLLDSAGIAITRTRAREVTVYADPDRLRQIMSNLLTNAARYCRPGDSVEVTIGEDDSAVLLVVRDNGPGMSSADAQQAFERFHRGATTEGVPGSGLGLAVVRALTLAQGGSVSLDSELGVGTTVTIRLPRWTGQGTSTD